MTMHDKGRLGPIEWATAGRPLPGEHVSGDQPIAVGIGDDAALFGVIDGLGHGPDAATAAIRAVDVLKNARNERLEVLVQLCHRVLGGSRGAAITLARVDFGAGTLTWTGVGNVTAHLVAKAATGVHIRSSARLAAGRSTARRRLDRHRYRRHRRRSSGPHRFRRVGHCYSRRDAG
jgi:negative regulator of sigma-B (phosphoserine phosphatase)